MNGLPCDVAARVLLAWLFAATGSSLPAQLRVSGTATSGGTIHVDVATADTTLEISVPGHGTRSLPVPPGKRVQVPVPDLPPGSRLSITVGRGGRRVVLQVEVGAP